MPVGLVPALAAMAFELLAVSEPSELIVKEEMLLEPELLTNIAFKEGVSAIETGVLPVANAFPDGFRTPELSVALKACTLELPCAAR